MQPPEGPAFDLVECPGADLFPGGTGVVSTYPVRPLPLPIGLVRWVRTAEPWGHELLKARPGAAGISGWVEGGEEDDGCKVGSQFMDLRCRVGLAARETSAPPRHVDHEGHHTYRGVPRSRGEHWGVAATVAPLSPPALRPF